MDISIKAISIALCLGATYPIDTEAALITGPGDPNYTTTFQGASAAMFSSLGIPWGRERTTSKWIRAPL